MKKQVFLIEESNSNLIEQSKIHQPILKPGSEPDEENRITIKIPKQSPLKQIRKFCIHCCGGSVKSVRFCHSLNCAQWYLRFGVQAKTFIRKNGKKSEKLFDKDNFKEGAQFSPDKEVLSYRI